MLQLSRFLERIPGAAVLSFSTVIDGRDSCGECCNLRCLVHELVVMCSTALHCTAVGQPVALVAILAIVTPVVIEVGSCNPIARIIAGAHCIPY